MGRWMRGAWASLVGLVSALVFLGVSELVSLAVRSTASPLVAVGSFVIDIVPRPLKEFAITAFGSADKLVLLIGVGIAAAVAAAIVGILALHRLWWGWVALAVVAGLSLAAILTRAGATGWEAIPPIVGALAAALVLAFLTRRLRAWIATRTPAREHPAPETPAEEAEGAAPDRARLSRRSFFAATALTAAVALAASVGGRIVSAVTTSLDAVREALRLPAPRSTVTIPDGAELDVPGLTPLITPNADFYRVDTALTVPSVDPASWRLVIDGMVEERVEIGFDELVGMGLDEYGITMTCVSNEVGGNLVGNAIWLGVPVRDLLRRARPQSGADMVLSRSVDGFTASTPLTSLTDDGIDAILAVGMNGEPLPFEHGFPVRMVVPGLYGYVSATKWLTQLTVTTFAADEAYWTPRGYSEKAPIKLSSRVDTPKIGSPVAPGSVPVAGVAWAQTVGIDRVEVSIDDGEWQQATLSAPINVDTWVQWRLDWDATPGTHYVTVRAIDKQGNMQIQEQAPIAPDGSSGWQRTLVSVSDS